MALTPIRSALQPPFGVPMAQIIGTHLLVAVMCGGHSFAYLFDQLGSVELYASDEDPPLLLKAIYGLTEDQIKAAAAYALTEAPRLQDLGY